MTLKESYQNAYERKNKAISAKLQTKKGTLTAKKKRLREQGEESLRSAYADYMRLSATSEQQSRAKGRFGGAAQNQKEGLVSEHSAKRTELKAKTAQEIAAVDEQIKEAEAAADKSIADNQTALRQKLDNIAIKEAEAAAKAAEKSVKAATTKKTSSKGTSGGKVSKSQAISLMKMGIYDASFAGILGISDEEVVNYIKNNGKKKNTNSNTQTNGTTKLPGTYKPPLK